MLSQYSPFTGLPLAMFGEPMPTRPAQPAAPAPMGLDSILLVLLCYGLPPWVSSMSSLGSYNVP